MSGGGPAREVEHRSWRRVVALAAALVLALPLLLTGCASLMLPPDEPGGSLTGRLSLRIDGRPERSLSAGFELSGTPAQGQLLLSGPLGTTAARARWSPGQAVLTSGGQDTAFADLDSLAAAALGEALPMAALFDWLRGRAWVGAPASVRADGLAGFEQLGWAINLVRWPEGAVDAVRPAPPSVLVRVRLDRSPS